jgi:Mn-containing catalase
MVGIVDEGEEVIAEGKKKDETAADLALIGAAQKVEHYEMSAYITARNLAQQLHQAPIVQFCSYLWVKKRILISYSTSSPGH